MENSMENMDIDIEVKIVEQETKQSEITWEPCGATTFHLA